MDDDRADRNPLQSLKPLNAEVEDHRQRRCLPDDEFQEFLAATHNGKTLKRICGPDRFMLYLVDGWTGLRAQELASLRPESFQLDGTEPAVTVQAGYSKHQREDVLSLRADLADLLRDWMRDRTVGERLWPGAWWNKAAEMVQADLDAANKKWVGEAADEEEGRRREQSGRFAYCDADGRFYDFHSLRGQFISTMENAGVCLKTLQARARHSRVETTLKHYVWVQLADVRSALDSLPGLPQGNSSEMLRATGTDGASAPETASPRLAFCLAEQGRFQGTPVNSNGRTTEGGTGDITRETPLNSGVFAGKQEGNEKEAPPGFEPGMADLQSAALPLG